MMINSSFYSLLYESSNPVRRWLHLSRKKWVTTKLQRYLEPLKSPRAIEVGFGDGAYLQVLLNFTQDVSAFDYSSGLIRDAGNWFGDKVKFIEGDIRTFEMKGKYDLILCTEVVEHIIESEIAIKNMSSWLEPGGVIILTTPNKYSILEICCRALRFSWVQRVATYIYKEQVQDLEHIGLVTESQLKKCFNKYNLRILEQDNLGLYIPVVAELFKSPITVKVLQRLESWIVRTPLRKFLWTQTYVLQKN